LTVTSGKSKVGVGVMVGVSVMVGVGVMVGVAVGVGVSVGVGVKVGVGVLLAVGVGVAKMACTDWQPLKARASPARVGIQRNAGAGLGDLRREKVRSSIASAFYPGRPGSGNHPLGTPAGSEIPLKG
jgi:hypothetical protein